MSTLTEIPEHPMRRETVYSEGGTPLISKPKLKTPDVFNGEYTVDYSILNWIVAVEKYLGGCRIPTSEFPMYAYTYMGKNVKAWYDSQYPGENRDWDATKKALVARWLPTDHRLQVSKRFDSIAQNGTLLDYVDRFQQLMVAVNQAGITKDPIDITNRFISGLNKEEDRRMILQREPKTLADAISGTMVLRQAKILSSRNNNGSQRHSKPTKSYAENKNPAYNVLKGEAKKQAFAKGLCIGCGKDGHWLADCPTAKKALNALKSASLAAKASVTPRPNHKKTKDKNSRRVKFNSVEVENNLEEDENEYDAANETEDPEISELESGDDQSESGNDSEGSQNSDP